MVLLWTQEVGLDEGVDVEDLHLTRDQLADGLDRTAHPGRIGDDGDPLVGVERLETELRVLPHGLVVVAGELGTEHVKSASIAARPNVADLRPDL